MRIVHAIAALAATTAFASPAFAQAAPPPPPASSPAQSNSTIEARALLIQPATIKGLDNLNFGTLIASATAAGTVRVDANDPTSARIFNVGTGTIVPGAGSALRGRLVGNGLPTQNVNLSWEFPDYLVNADDNTVTMPFLGEMDTSSNDGSVQIGATGVFYMYVGGTITVAPNQMPGQYSGVVKVNADFQ